MKILIQRLKNDEPKRIIGYMSSGIRIIIAEHEKGLTYFVYRLDNEKFKLIFWGDNDHIKLESLKKRIRKYLNNIKGIRYKEL